MPSSRVPNLLVPVTLNLRFYIEITYDCLEKNIYYKASLILSVSSERWNGTRKTLKMKQYYNTKEFSISS